MNSFERCHFHVTCSVADDENSITESSLRKRVVSALRNCLGAPLDHFSTLEIVTKQRRRLETLKELVNIERGLLVIQPYDNAECNQSRRQWIHEASAECVVRK